MASLSESSLLNDIMNNKKPDDWYYISDTMLADRRNTSIHAHAHV